MSLLRKTLVKKSAVYRKVPHERNRKWLIGGNAGATAKEKKNTAITNSEHFVHNAYWSSPF